MRNPKRQTSTRPGSGVKCFQGWFTTEFRLTLHRFGFDLLAAGTVPGGLGLGPSRGPPPSTNADLLDCTLKAT